MRTAAGWAEAELNQLEQKLEHDERVRAPALSTPETYKVRGNEICKPDVATVDALSVGLSLRTLARTKLTGETAAAYDRVGSALVAAARLALAEGK